MKIFRENNEFQKGNYIVMGVCFSQPKRKRKNYATDNIEGVSHWTVNVFSSAKHRISIEIIESCKSQKTKLADWGSNANGTTIIFRDVNMWSETNGLMDGLTHEILVFNPCGPMVDHFLVGVNRKLQIDESFSSNVSWYPWAQPESTKKFKQSLRLARYYRKIRNLNLAEFKPQKKLDEAIKQHFGIEKRTCKGEKEYQPYYLAFSDDTNKDILLGIGVEFTNELLNLQIISKDGKEHEEVQVSVANLQEEVKEKIREATEANLILMVTHCGKTDAVFQINPQKRNVLIIFDQNIDHRAKYNKFLSVSKISITFFSLFNNHLRVILRIAS